LSCLNLGHLAVFFRGFSADGAFTNLIFYHGVIRSTCSAKFIPGKNVANIDECKANAKDPKNYD